MITFSSVCHKGLTIYVARKGNMSYHSSGGGGSSSNDKFASINSNCNEEDNDGGIKDPRPREYQFEKELIKNQNKHVYVVDDFVPSRSTRHLTAKFYARHEQFQPEKQYLYRSFVERPEIIQHRSENHVYGWMPQSLKGPSSSYLLSQLNFISAPKQRCCLTVYGEELCSDHISSRPPFNGLRFYLQ